jgi:hypothetical protein
MGAEAAIRGFPLPSQPSDAAAPGQSLAPAAAAATIHHPTNAPMPIGRGRHLRPNAMRLLLTGSTGGPHQVLEDKTSGLCLSATPEASSSSGSSRNMEV